jgi:hypothetical protein
VGLDRVIYRQRVQIKLLGNRGDLLGNRGALLLVGVVEVDPNHSAPLAAGLVGFFQGGRICCPLAVDVDGVVNDHLTIIPRGRVKVAAPSEFQRILLSGSAEGVRCLAFPRSS